LIVDHTLAFIRLVWTFFLPILIMFGYPPSFVVTALAIIYVFYLLIDLLWMLVSWVDVGAEARAFLRGNKWIVVAMPVYRMLVFWFRMSGFLYAVAEPGSWRVKDPVTQTRDAMFDLISNLQKFFSRK
jgi:hypothetical protein